MIKEEAIVNYAVWCKQGWTERTIPHILFQSNFSVAILNLIYICSFIDHSTNGTTFWATICITPKLSYACYMSKQDVRPSTKTFTMQLYDV